MSDDDNLFEFNRNRSLDNSSMHPGHEKLIRLPKRFYKQAEAAALEDGFTVLLDGKGVKTPARSALKLPSRALTVAIAEEWARQGEKIDPRSMWLTKLANTAIDLVTPRRATVTDEIVNFAGTDLLCYRADKPVGLVERQSASWDALLAWAGDAHGIRFRTTTSLMHVAQDEAALQKMRAAVSAFNDFVLAGLHNAVTLTGSSVIGLALAHGRLDADAAFEAAHIEDKWQAELFGEDEEEAERLALRLSNLQDTARFMTLAVAAP
jgi:chaperone required for assembly of F1-ATPase